jgi:hypothetical protein
MKVILMGKLTKHELEIGFVKEMLSLLKLW